LAKASGVPVVTISRIENGKGSRMPHQSTIRKLSRALDIEGAWLLLGETEKLEIAGRDAY
jgi:transcriptional regulator with XRE-family HTH domain